MKRSIIYIAAFVTAMVLLVALNAQMRRTAAAERALTENTRAAVAEISAELEVLTLSLDKLLLTTSPRQTAALLTQIALSADRAQTDIADLPDRAGQQAAILGHLSRLSRLNQDSLTTLALGNPLPTDTLSQFSAMSNDLRLLQAEITLALQSLLTGEELSAALPASEVTAPPTAMELTTYKALPSQEISSGEAMQIAKEFVGAERVLSVQHAPDTAGALPAYGVTIQTPDVQLNLEITRRGGKVLLMVPETAAFPMVKTVDECRQAALSFLNSHGFARMEALYYQVYDGLCVWTCTYVQDDVLVWADRVLVQVRMDTAEVVGLEARSYWQNHIPRRLQTPLLTETEARASLARDAEVSAVRLCLLPTGSQERLCWQFTLTVQEEEYISYVDALTGDELLLEKVMQLESGSIPA